MLSHPWVVVGPDFLQTPTEKPATAKINLMRVSELPTACLTSQHALQRLSRGPQRHAGKHFEMEFRVGLRGKKCDGTAGICAENKLLSRSLTSTGEVLEAWSNQNLAASCCRL